MINSGMYIPRVPSIGTTRSRPAGIGSAPWHMNANLALDWVNDRSYRAGVSGNSTSPLTTTRTTTKNVPNSAGVYSAFGSNVTARTDLGMSVELGRTNSILQTVNFQNAAWTVSGGGADLTLTKNRTDLLNVANNLCTIQVNTNGATLTQATGDAANVARWPSMLAILVSSSNDVPGIIEMSIDGVNFDDVTPNGGLEFRDGVTRTGANPTITIRFSKAGDVWAIYYVAAEKTSSTHRTSPMFSGAGVFVRGADDVRLTATTNTALDEITLVEWTELAGPVGSARVIWQQRVDSNNLCTVEILANNRVQCRVRATGDQCNMVSANPVVQGATYRVAFSRTTNSAFCAMSASLGAVTPPIDTGITMPVGAYVMCYGANGNGAAGSSTAQATALIRWCSHHTLGSLSQAQMQAWAGSTVDSAISFSDGETFSPPAGLTWPASVNGIAIPQSVTWSAGSSKFIITGNPALTSFVNPAIASATAFYADASKPDDTGNGLTAGTAKQKISSAIALANADGGSAARIIVAAGTYYQDTSINGSGAAVEPTKPMGFFSSGGYVLHVCSTAWSFPGSPDGTFTNSYVGGPATALRAFDKLTLDSYGLYTEIPALASQAAVDASGATGGWYNSGGVTTIRRPDGARPTLTNTLITGDFDVARLANAANDIYFQGFRFEGGKNGALTLDKVGATRNGVITDGYARYSGGTSNLWDACILQGLNGFFLVHDFDVSRGMKDGLNLTTSPFPDQAYYMVVNPTGWGNGKTPAANCNWLTGHTSCITWIAAQPVSNGGDSLGPDIHFIDTTKTYIVGLWSKATTRGGVDPSSFKASTSAEMWLEKVTAESSNKTFSAVGGGSTPAKIHKRGTRTISGVQSAASGGIIDTF